MEDLQEYLRILVFGFGFLIPSGLLLWVLGFSLLGPFLTSLGLLGLIPSVFGLRYIMDEFRKTQVEDEDWVEL